MAKIVRVRENEKIPRRPPKPRPKGNTEGKKYRLLTLVLSQVYNMSRLYSSFADEEKFSKWVSHYVKLGYLKPGEANTLSLAKRRLDKLIEESISKKEYKTPLIVLAEKAIKDVLGFFKTPQKEVKK